MGFAHGEEECVFIFNNVICELYRCRTYRELEQYFLPVLKMLIPFRYASIMRQEEKAPKIRLVDPPVRPQASLWRRSATTCALPTTTTPAGSTAAGSPPCSGKAI